MRSVFKRCRASLRTAAVTAVCFVCMAAVPPAHADHALVIGVNEYPKLATGSNLEGCVNDANTMETSLKAHGFQVTLLTNEGATHAAVLVALDRMKRASTPAERFVFYFAGHGTIASDGSSALLAHDAGERSETGDVTRDELYGAIRAVPARSRTVLLDSCFAGGLSMVSATV